MMKNRRSVMMVSAFMIACFHLWVPLGMRNPAEIFLQKTAFIGVDMFFFLSAYSISAREVTDYKAFLVSRLKSVYLKFILFAVVACIYAHWKLPYLFRVVTGLDLFKKGGGAFLWFLPAIMLFYLILPLYQKLDKKNRPLAIGVGVGAWFIIGLLVTFLTKYKAMFIFWNRIPIVLVGFYAAKLMHSERVLSKKGAKALAGVLLLAVGSVLLYFFGYQPPLMKPIPDMYYVIAIPSTLGLILLTDLIPECGFSRVVGAATLEMYAVQMIFGYDFSAFVLNRIAKSMGLTTGTKLLVNVISVTFVVAVAVLINQIYERIRKRIR